MKSLSKVIQVSSLALILAAAGGLSGAEGDTVMSPAKRQDALDKSKKLLAPREINPVNIDPFHPEAFAEMVAGLGRVAGAVVPAPSDNAKPAGPRTDRDLLQAIALNLKPSGYIVLGGQPSLSFGQKRVKPGGFLTITFEGNEYTLEISAIDRTNFTLRLNREEFTRTIK